MATFSQSNSCKELILYVCAATTVYLFFAVGVASDTKFDGMQYVKALAYDISLIRWIRNA